MKVLAPLLLFISSFATAQLDGNSEQINSDTNPKYPLEAGLVTYSISGDGSGTSTLHFDRNGWRVLESRDLTMTRYGISSQERTVELTDGDYTYKANLDANTGSKKYDKNWSRLLNYKTKGETIEAIMTSKGGTLSGQEALLERTCNVWVFNTGTTLEIWEWEGIPLKVKKKLPGISYEVTATSIEVITEIPEEHLTSLTEIDWVN
ncbi:MAG: hypothetical protein CMB80_26465 [Flammeovirgaceae bacterium]|nr:hypothetical protein [Flammeovirgaceae bacterium]MBE61310.1 hypothetical protein [Flammeovirgaceae bacterium]|tara:strand:- start:836 stop:1453 length:618 start_codon:yes stop_codon:yes gene_type:complete